MKIFPFEKLTLVTVLSKDKVIEELNSSIRPKQNFGFGKQEAENGKQFEGIIYGDNFTIERIINYRNSFIPEIKGKIIEKITGTEIEIILKPASSVMAFMTVWLGGMSLAFITTLIGVIIEKAAFETCIMPLVMLFVGFGMLKIGFSTESEKSKKEIIEILQAKIK